VEAGGADPMTLSCDSLVNCAGLGAQTVARGISGVAADSIPPLHPAKGNYFYLTGPSPFQRLIYPMPDAAWLGVHVGLDLALRCKFGPDMHWVEELDYDVDEAQAEAFYASIRRYWPELPDDALQPDYTGIRPKIYAKGQAPRDFYIQCADEHGVPGLVNLYGIESPGLTSSIAIGAHVAGLVTNET
jgi:L-2-hydroxyglutarate oxidase LhgO